MEVAGARRLRGREGGRGWSGGAGLVGRARLEGMCTRYTLYLDSECLGAMWASRRELRTMTNALNDLIVSGVNLVVSLWPWECSLPRVLSTHTHTHTHIHPPPPHTDLLQCAAVMIACYRMDAFISRVFTRTKTTNRNK